MTGANAVVGAVAEAMRPHHLMHSTAGDYCGGCSWQGRDHILHLADLAVRALRRLEASV
jgi:hypothetical protein